MIAKCPCEHCGVNIEFATEEFLSGSSVPCPTCGKETPIFVSPEAKPPAQPQAQQSPRFFVWQNDQQQGPFEQETIQQMILDGQILEDTMLCPEDGGLDWTPAKELFFQESTPESLGASDLAETPQIQPDPAVQIQISAHKVFTCYLNEGSNNTVVEIRLTSGAELKVKAVRLFDLTTLQVIEGRKNEAARNNQGVSTGLGSIGSLGWVLASSVVIGAVEGVLSANAAAHGKDAFTSAIELEMKLRNEGVFMPVGVISNIQHPLLSIWLAPGETSIGDKVFQDSYVHNGEDFLTVQTDDGAVQSIRWSTVESYVFKK